MNEIIYHRAMPYSRADADPGTNSLDVPVRHVSTRAGDE